MAIGIDFLLEEWIVPFLKSKGIEFLRAPGNVTIIAMILAFYDSVLWKLPFFKLLVNIPNISGRYKGNIKFEFNGVKGQKECYIEVKQSASKIKIHSYFNNELNEKSDSKSLVEDVRLEEDGFFDIYMFYLNNGNKINSSLDCHEGANKLRYIPANKARKAKLTGHYFTNRQIQTRGEIEAEFETSNLKGEF
ncbi:hypothetical protein WH52_01315 [Tenacibaculum holothuriorum]|uniref:CD-NTase-associated protein 15 domain-containing protein n=1 Tax=Tenacibaculum holothuriorum TaxID=1635173 RepID=A0A1Y2PI11_9FLAO|nr:hypothetical protein [Tenacibaculum holothuriorum]OSY89308.1 hypothetical protein WH52_01315 [Tenacibaculum holothuriorum]